MINEENYFYSINLSFEFINNIYEELNHSNWYNSKLGIIRSEILGETRALIKKSMPFNIFCCGFMKNVPGFKYNPHKDILRTATVNILLVDPSDDYKAVFYVRDDQGNITQTIDIPYLKDKPILLNTKEFHSVYNTSKDKTRYILSIGCADESYEVIKNRFKQLSNNNYY